MTINKSFLYAGIAALIFIIDRYTKIAALLWCGLYNEVSFFSLPFIFCHPAINRGVSWGWFHSESMAVFCFVSAVIVMITAVITYHAYNRLVEGYCIVGEVCVIAGSCSNIFDRFYYLGVVDFILFSYNDVSFPVFNIADIAIVLGVCVMMIQSYYER